MSVGLVTLLLALLWSEAASMLECLHLSSVCKNLKVDLTYSDGCNNIRCVNGRGSTTLMACHQEDPTKPNDRSYCNKVRLNFILALGEAKSRTKGNLYITCKGLRGQQAFKKICAMGHEGKTLSDGCNQFNCRQSKLVSLPASRECVSQDMSNQQHFEYCEQKYKEVIQLLKIESKLPMFRPVPNRGARRGGVDKRTPITRKPNRGARRRIHKIMPLPALIDITKPISVPTECKYISAKLCSKLKVDISFFNGCNHISCRNGQATSSLRKCAKEMPGKVGSFCDQMRRNVFNAIDQLDKNKKILCKGIDPSNLWCYVGDTITVSDGCNEHTCRDGDVSTKRSSQRCSPEKNNPRDKEFCDEKRRIFDDAIVITEPDPQNKRRYEENFIPRQKTPKKKDFRIQCKGISETFCQRYNTKAKFHDGCRMINCDPRSIDTFEARIPCDAEVDGNRNHKKFCDALRKKFYQHVRAAVKKPVSG